MAHAVNLSNRQMRYLVTGGLGFVGHNLVSTLVDVGHDVKVLDNLNANCVAPDFLANRAVGVVVGDVTNPETCMQVTSDGV